MIFNLVSLFMAVIIALFFSFLVSASMNWGIYFSIFSYLKMKFIFSLGFNSKLFLIFFLIISLTSFYYSNYYMSYTNLLMRFTVVTLLFIFSMIILIFGKSFMSMYVGWDGLGVSSFCLVLFFMNMKSQNSAMTTIMMNRVGDGLFIVFILMTMFTVSYGFYSFNLSFFISLTIMLAFLTKSAQYPFSTWLPLAMAAPTPISALVHSSTLVAAGIYLFIENSEFIFNKSLIFLIFLLTIFTLFMSGMSSFFEMDMKKIIALSTLNQLSLMFMGVVFCLKFFSFFHLLSHALFKSLLFFNAGIFIHIWFNNQDFRFYNSSLSYSNILVFSFIFSLLNLMGLMMLMGFYSKDILIEMVEFQGGGLFITILFFILVSMTFFYSLRLMKMCLSTALFYKNLKLFMYSDMGTLPLKNMFFLIFLLEIIMLNNFIFKCVSINSLKSFIITYLLVMYLFISSSFYMEGVYKFFFSSMVLLNLLMNKISVSMSQFNNSKFYVDTFLFSSVLNYYFIFFKGLSSFISSPPYLLFLIFMWGLFIWM